MPSKPKTPKGRIEVAAGYGVKVYVERGHLVVHDGIGRDRETRRFSRAASKLDRLVVIGHTGFITLEAMRWIKDIGASFVQIDADSNVVAMSVSEWYSSSRHLRRAQVLAAETDVGRALLAQLLKTKLIEQARLAGELQVYKPPRKGRSRPPYDPQGSILDQIAELERAETMGELRLAESIAGRHYWQCFAHLPIRFERRWRAQVPEHWHRAGPRTSPTDRKRAKRAQTPAHAILNYLYAILQTEATIAAQRMGFDPTLGLMHADKRYRPSLAADLMEPVRPLADRVASELLLQRNFRRGDVLETRQGICRLGPDLARELGPHAHVFREAVGPHAERLARNLLGAEHHPTPLTRRRHQAAREAKVREASR
jgi:CRISPR-associated endonuclease Cas1